MRRDIAQTWREAANWRETPKKEASVRTVPSSPKKEAPKSEAPVRTVPGSPVRPASSTIIYLKPEFDIAAFAVEGNDCDPIMHDARYRETQDYLGGPADDTIIGLEPVVSWADTPIRHHISEEVFAVDDIDESVPQSNSSVEISFEQTSIFNEIVKNSEQKILEKMMLRRADIGRSQMNLGRFLSPENRERVFEPYCHELWEGFVEATRECGTCREFDDLVRRYTWEARRTLISSYLVFTAGKLTSYVVGIFR